MLNEAVCFLGNVPLQMSNKTPFFPSLLLQPPQTKRKEKYQDLIREQPGVVRFPHPNPVPSVFTLLQ